MQLSAVITLYFVLYSTCAWCQNTQLENFGDITSVSQPDLSKWKQVKNFSFSPGNLNAPIDYNQSPVVNASNDINLQGWIGEKVNAEAVISTTENISSLNVTISNLTSANGS